MNMRRFISCILCMFFVFISNLLLVVPIAGATGATAAYGALKFEMLTDENANVITKNLDLSVSSIYSAYPSVKITWKSSNPKVVSVNESQKVAVITRPNSNTKVTLTAILFVSGELPIHKPFEFTVLRNNIIICTAETFTKPAETGISVEKTTLFDSGWSMASKASEDDYLASIELDPEDTSNYVLKAHRKIGNNTDYQTTRLTFPTKPVNNPGFSSRIRITPSSLAGNDGLCVFTFTGRKGSASAQLMYIQMTYTNAAARIAATINGSTLVTTITDLPPMDTWFDFGIEFDLSKGTFIIKVDDFTSDVLSFMDAADTSVFSEVSYITMHPIRTANNCILYMDDILMTDEEPYSSVTGGVSCELNGTKAAVRTSFNETYDLVQVASNMIPYASNKNYGLDFSGISLLEKSEPNFFAEGIPLSKGSGEAPAFKINGEYLGVEHGQPSGVLINSPLHGKGVGDVGSIWKDGANVGWTLLSIIDEDSILFLSENLGESVYKYRFEDSVSGNLSYVSNGSNTSSIYVNSQEAQKEISVAKSPEKSVYVVSGNSRTKLGNSARSSGNYIEFVEKYEIINPATIAETLSGNRPNGGYTTNVEFAQGETLVNFSLTYRIDITGQMIIVSNHEVRVDTNAFSSFSYDAVRSIEREDAFSGGIIRYDSQPDREIVYYMDEGVAQAAVISGVLPVLDVKNKRIQKQNDAFTSTGQRDLPKNGNPAFIPDTAFPEGNTDMSVMVVSYRAFLKEPDGTYNISYDGEDYLFFDFIDSMNLSADIDLKARDVLLTDQSSGVSYSLAGNQITATSSGTGNYLVLKLGEEENDLYRAKIFITQYAGMLGIDISDADYVNNEADVIAGFLSILSETPPKNKTDITNALKRAIAVPAFQNLKVSQVEAMIIKYADVLGILASDYQADYTKYGAVEIGKALAGSSFNSAAEITEAYSSRIRVLREENESTRTGSFGGSRGGSSADRNSNVFIPDTIIQPQPHVAKQEFSDLPTEHWGAEYVNKLVEMDILTGFGDGTVQPDANVTREQFVKMLVVALDLYEKDSKCDFTDVDSQDWAYHYIASGVDKEIVLGYPDNIFKPNENISRQDMAVMTVRSITTAKITLANANGEAHFADEIDIASYAAESIHTLQAAGIIQGVGDNLFSPEEYSTRAQAAKIIYMICTFL